MYWKYEQIITIHFEIYGQFESKNYENTQFSANVLKRDCQQFNNSDVVTILFENYRHPTRP